MPIRKCKGPKGGSGYKWGKKGKCYTGKQGKAKARKQGAAIEASKMKRRQ